ncbi:MAG: hypothetical protein KDB80_13725, partial [Planctomycetes bacterium]|nr:hypothetical protein [Planctomycetota bacterium]
AEELEVGSLSFDGAADDDEFDLEISDEVEFLEEPDEPPFVVVDHADPERGDVAANLNPDDLLFEDDREDVSEVSTFGAELGVSFGEQSGFELPDEDVTADGFRADSMELVGDEFTVSSDADLHDLEDASDDWDDIEDRPAPADLSPQEAGSFGVLEPAEELLAPVDEEWGEAAEIDPIYGDAMAEDGEYVEAGAVAAGEVDVAGEFDEEVDYSEYEEAYADGTGPAGPSYEVRGGVAARSRWKLVASLAAVLPIAVVGAVAWWNPQWFGSDAEPDTQSQVVLVDRIQVERPSVELVAKLPEVTFHAPVVEPVEPRIGDPEVNVAPTEPRVAIPDPDTVPTPDDIDPREPGSVAVAPEIDPSEPSASESQNPNEFVQAGDNLLIARFSPDRVARGPAVAVNLTPGRQAFAQLHNGSYFTGTVRRVDSSMITLALTVGEVALRYDELKVLTPLENADLSEVTSTQRGFVRLRNQQRLVGAILRSPENDRVTLMGDGTIVDVPNWQIESVGYEPVQGLDILDDEDDDDWLRCRVRSRLNNR